MKHIIRISTIMLITTGFFTSCTETRKRATDELNQLNQEAEELNSAIDDGLKKVEGLDSLVRTGVRQTEEYDSLIKRGSSKIDSIAKKKAKAWQDLTDF